MLRSTSITLIFHLLAMLASLKDRAAPQIYKLLTFLLVDSFHHLEVREELLSKFSVLFADNEGIPVSILCDPLLKVYALTLEQLEPDTLQPPKAEYGPSLISKFTFSTVDFQFLFQVAKHAKLTLANGIALLGLVCQTMKKLLVFSKVCYRIVQVLVLRFQVESDFAISVKEQAKIAVA